MKRQGSLCFFIFKAITLALQKSRRERLKEELDSDFEHTFSKKARNRVVRSYIYRAAQDLARVQYLNPLSFSLIMILVFVATTRTASISLLGIVVFQVVFSRGGNTYTRSGHLYELFFQLVLLVVLGNIILGIPYGIGTSSNKLGLIPFILFGFILIAFLVNLVSSILEPDKQSSKPQIAAKWLHMSIICLFIFDLTVGKNTISQVQLTLFGTLGWLVILWLGVLPKQESPASR
jgi:hypothetical protein